MLLKLPLIILTTNMSANKAILNLKLRQLNKNHDDIQIYFKNKSIVNI